MKRIYLFIVVLMHFVLIFGQDTWQKALNPTTSSFTFSNLSKEILITPGGYYILGTSYTTYPDAGLCIIKTNKSGIFQWAKQIQIGSSGESVISAKFTSNGYIIGCGSTASIGGGGSDFMVFKADTSGNIIWIKAIGKASNQTAYDIIETSTGNYVAAGTIDGDFGLVGFSSSGDTLFTKAYNLGGTEDFIQGICETSKGYALLGKTNSTTFGGRDMIIMFTDKNGKPLSGSTASYCVYGGSDDEYSIKIKPTADKGLIILGNTESYGITSGWDTDILLMKTDSNGVIEWSKQIGEKNYTYTYPSIYDDYAYNLLIKDDGNYVISGQIKHIGAGSWDIINYEVDKDGDLLWGKTYGSNLSERYEVASTIDNNYLITLGFTAGFNLPSKSFYLIKSDLEGNSGSSNESDAFVTIRDSIILRSCSTVSPYHPAMSVTSGSVTATSISVSNKSIPEVEETTFKKRISKETDDVNINASMAQSNGFIVSGYVENGSSSNEETYLAKLNANGDIDWHKSYGFDLEDKSYKIIENNKGYLMIGITKKDDSNGDGLLVQTDFTGDVLWAQIYGESSKTDMFSRGITASDGNCYIAGRTKSLGGGTYYGSLLMKISTSGDSIWVRGFGNSTNSIYGKDVCETMDGSIILLSSVYQSSSNNGILLIKLNADGDTLWTKTYSGTGDDDFNIIKPTADNGFVLFGTIVDEADSRRSSLLKFDMNGNIEWYKNYRTSSYSYGYDMIVDKDGGYVLACRNNPQDFVAIKTDNKGAKVWAKTYFYPMDLTFSSVPSVSKTNDNGYMFAFGARLSTGNYNGYVIKTDKDGIAGNCHESNVSINTSSSNYNPMPFALSTSVYMKKVKYMKYISADMSTGIPSIIEDELEISVDSSSVNVKCFGQNNGSISLTTANGIQPYSFSWSNSATTEDITSIAAGNYTVTIADDLGCQMILPFSITQPALLTASTGKSDVTCHHGTNGTAWVVPSGGTSPYTFFWNNGLINDTVQNLYAGSYFVNVVDNNSCAAATQMVTISQPAQLSHTLSASDVTCYKGSNGSVTLQVNNGTSPYSFNWSNSSTSQNLSSISAGIYKVTITDQCADQLIDSIEIEQPDSLSLGSSVTDITCNGKTDGYISVSVSEGTSPYSYSWSNSSSNSVISALAAGVYKLTVQDACAIQKVDSFIVSEPLLLTAAVTGTNVSCNGLGDGTATVTPSGGTSPFIYSWSNQQNKATAVGLFAGLYTVNVTDVNNCLASANITITQPEALAISLEASSSSCGKQSGTINAKVSGGTKPYTFNWSNLSSDTIIKNLMVGTYTLTVTDNNACSKTSSSSIETEAIATSICIVTVDSATGKNLITWQKSSNQAISHYNVYKQSYDGTFDFLAKVDYDSLAVLVDGTSEPEVKADKYKISVVDSCGNESQLSSHHKTIHLNVSPNAQGNGNALTWTHYEGFSFNSYIIYRGTSSTKLSPIDTLAYNLSSFTYTDLDVDQQTMYYYRVAALRGSSCDPKVLLKASSGPFSQSVSNLEDNRLKETAATGNMPTDIILYSGKLYDNSPAGSAAGTFETEDVDVADKHTYSLVSGTGDKNNSSFTISYDTLKIASVLAENNYYIRVRSTENTADAYYVDKTFTVSVTKAGTSVSELKEMIGLSVYPNPYKGATIISYELNDNADVLLEVLSILGKDQKTLVNQKQQPGKYQYKFNAGVPGIYFVRLTVDGVVLTEKIIEE